MNNKKYYVVEIFYDCSIDNISTCLYTSFYSTKKDAESFVKWCKKMNNLFDRNNRYYIIIEV